MWCGGVSTFGGIYLYIIFGWVYKNSTTGYPTAGCANRFMHCSSLKLTVIDSNGLKKHECAFNSNFCN